MHYKKGQVVNIYFAPQTNSELIGTAKLLEYISTGLPFVLTEAESESRQITYSTEKWRVKFLSTTPLFKDSFNIQEIAPAKIRYIYSKGIAPQSSRDSSLDTLPKDKFLKVNGKEIY